MARILLWAGEFVLIFTYTRYPKVHLEVRTGLGPELLTLFTKGELDLMIAREDEHLKPDRLLFKEPLVWMAHHAYKLNTDGLIPLVMLPSPCIFKQLGIEALTRQGKHWELVYTGSGVASVLAAVNAGLGVTVLPISAMSTDMRMYTETDGFLPLSDVETYLYVGEGVSTEVMDLFVGYIERQLAMQAA